jgi:glucose-fructose oxidoreductase
MSDAIREHGNGDDNGKSRKSNGKVRYGVVGVGHIAQVAVLPAFEHAKNCELVALVSGDATKLEELGKRYGVERCTDYAGYDALVQSDELDAVYIALPNHMHCDFAVRALRAGKHVLCEKPMAITTLECDTMNACAEQNGVKLMIAYRLHFERANLEAIDLLERGDLGDVRLFESVISQSVKPSDVRLMPVEQGGGPVYDLGVYCINAARYLFRDEPVEVRALSAASSDPRFEHCEEMMSVMLRFPGERVAGFTVSFGAAEVSTYRVVCSNGELRMDPAYEYAIGLSYEVQTELYRKTARFEKRDQFAPQLIYFSECITNDVRPEPDGHEGLADVRIIEAIYQAAKSGRPVQLESLAWSRRPNLRQAMDIRGIEKPEQIHASGPRD